MLASTCCSFSIMPELESTAQDHVLATTELLELVFLCLDVTTLFAIQRVCRKWNSLIGDSRKLQEHMFLRAPSNTRQPSPTNQDRNISLQYCDGELYADHSIEVTLCPILDIATQYARTQAGSIAASCNQSALRGSPSWHRMLLTMPPCKSATVALWWRIGESMRGSIYLESVTSSTGLRFADVAEATFAQTKGNWKDMPDGKLLPLSAVGPVTLDEFLKLKAGEDVRMMESTSVFFLRMF
jgi:hypothetical protein